MTFILESEGNSLVLYPDTDHVIFNLKSVLTFSACQLLSTL